jgi:tRNA pseudouridine55 synthase
VRMRRVWSGPFDAKTASRWTSWIRAKTDALDHLILPLEAGLIDLPRVHCPESSVAKLRNGNPAPRHGRRRIRRGMLG